MFLPQNEDRLRIFVLTPKMARLLSVACICVSQFSRNVLKAFVPAVGAPLVHDPPYVAFQYGPRSGSLTMSRMSPDWKSVGLAVMNACVAAIYCARRRVA